MRRLPVAAAISACVVIVGPELATATAADVADAEAVVTAFGERMVAAGYVSAGASDPASDDEADDELFAKCEVDYRILSALESEEGFTGETARVFSDDFVLAPGGVPPTTDFLDLGGDEQRAGALVITVGEGGTDQLDAVVEAFGSPELAECVEQSFQQSLDVANTDPGELAMPADALQLETSSAADLGVGDASASFSVEIDADFEGFILDLGTSVHLARVDRSLVGVLLSRSGPPVELPIDPIAELAALAGAVAGG